MSAAGPRWPASTPSSPALPSPGGPRGRRGRPAGPRMRVDRASRHVGHGRDVRRGLLGQLPRSRWYAVPATAVAGADDRQRLDSATQAAYGRAPGQVAWDGARHAAVTEPGRCVGVAPAAALCRPSGGDRALPRLSGRRVTRVRGALRARSGGNRKVKRCSTPSPWPPAGSSGGSSGSMRAISCPRLKGCDGLSTRHCVSPSATVVTGPVGRSCCWTPTNGSRLWMTGSGSSCCRISPPMW